MTSPPEQNAFGDLEFIMIMSLTSDRENSTSRGTISSHMLVVMALSLAGLLSEMIRVRFLIENSTSGADVEFIRLETSCKLSAARRGTDRAIDERCRRLKVSILRGEAGLQVG
ncbi:hypothetical protein OGAPHI_000223 [Ogataea philodendri]|uniref:Uncharacterized protein n=1 Tax=Ogataea philodendri TaxID=1378263 RepID=A0A9P8PH21_9ASCO|nr:uncharacterized protein OGAPHI_000223 [Ogataea philodendri]KAH3671520.1 hypothetical protein OGAPHI_000223 [Ogataea philodendri]